MWINTGRKPRVRSFKVLLVPSMGRKIVIAKTPYFGYALDIARYFEHRFVDEDEILYKIEVR